MDNTIINKYNDALTAEQKSLADYIASATVALPANASDVSVGRSDFLTKSGWTFNVIGILAFIIGLIVGATGLWITGCAAITAGCYCIFKGKQQLKSIAYQSVGNNIFSSVEDMAAHVSKSWTDFVLAQNDSLRKDLLGSDMDQTDKLNALDNISDSSVVRFDEDTLKSDIVKAAGEESIPDFDSFVPEAKQSLTKSLDLAAKAQSDLYKRISASPSAK